MKSCNALISCEEFLIGSVLFIKGYKLSRLFCQIKVLSCLFICLFKMLSIITRGLQSIKKALSFGEGF